MSANKNYGSNLVIWNINLLPMRAFYHLILCIATRNVNEYSNNLRNEKGNEIYTVRKCYNNCVNINTHNDKSLIRNFKVNFFNPARLIICILHIYGY